MTALNSTVVGKQYATPLRRDRLAHSPKLDEVLVVSLVNSD